MRLDLDLLPWQNEFLHSTATVKALSGASDTGKSWICRLHLILTCLQYPKNRCFATATTWTQTHRAVAEPIIQFLEDQDVRIDYEVYPEGRMRPVGGSLSSLARLDNAHGLIMFSNGSRIELYSSDKLYYRIRSLEYGTGFVEEASVIDDKHIEKLYYEAVRRLRKPDVPHHLLMAMNPSLRTRWLWKNFFAKPPKDSYIKKLSFKDGWNVNDKEREAKIKMGSPWEIRIYYDGDWVYLEGQAFHLVEGEHIKEIKTGDLEKFYITFDYGYSPDPMVYLLVSFQNGIIFVIDEFCWTEVPSSEHETYLQEWYEEYNIVGYTGETATGAGEIRNILNRQKLRYYPTTKKRSQGWTSLANRIHKRTLVIDPRCVKTLESLECMAWVPSTKGVDCEGDFDDPADALRYFDQCPLVQMGGERKIIIS